MCPRSRRGEIEKIKKLGYDYCGVDDNNSNYHLFVLRGENNISLHHIHCYDKDKTNIGEVSTKARFELLEGCEYITFNTYTGVTNDLNSPIQLEEGTQVTAYEPFGYIIKGKSCGKNLCIGEGDFYGYCDDTHNIYHAKNNTQPLSFNLKPNTTYTRIMYDCEFKGDYVYMFDSIKEIDGTYKQYPYFLRSTICVAAFTTGEKGGINEYVFNPESGTARTPGFFVKVGKLVILEGDYTQTPLEELPYEPYQESTYSIHSPIPLRSLPSGVCDVYDFESGAVIQKVGKVVLDGSEDDVWLIDNDSNPTSRVNTVCFRLDNINDLGLTSQDKLLCNTLNHSEHVYGADREGVMMTNVLRISINKDKLTSLSNEGFKQWLSENPTTIYYKLKEPIIYYSTPSQLKSFEGTTHVISENTLIPTTTTKILTDTYANVSNVNSTAYSLRRGVNDVAETSAIINETDVEQDDVLDVTMCAIDELYSMLEPNLE